MLISMLVNMLYILVLCRVLLTAGVQTLTIDSQLGTSIEDCFERISIGEHLPPNAIYRNMSELTNRECELICKQDKQCQAYDYGVGAKGNATCNLSTLDEKTIKEQNPLKRHPDYDVYIRRFQCEQSPPTPIQPLSDDPGPGPQHRPVFRPEVDERPSAEDYLVSGDLNYGKPSESLYRPDDISNTKPDYDAPPSYGDLKPQDIPYRPGRPNDPYKPDRPNDKYRPERPRDPPYGSKRPQNPPYGSNRPNDPYSSERPADKYKPQRPNGPHRPEPNDVLQFQDIGKPRPDEYDRPDPYRPEKPDYHYIIRPNRKPGPHYDYSKPSDPYFDGHPSGPVGPPNRPYQPTRPHDKPSYSYNEQYASNYGQNGQNDNSLYVEIHDPPRPYIPIKDRPNQQYNGQGYLGYGTYSSQNSYSQSQNSQYLGTITEIGGGYGLHDKPQATGYGPPAYDERPQKPNYGPPVFDERPQKPGYKPPAYDERPQKPGYGPPVFDERPPKPGYEPPAYDERPQTPGYGPPVFDEKPQKPGYGPTINDKPQKPGYETSNNGYDSGYGQRPNDYEKPSYGNQGSYGDNQGGYGSNQGGYGSNQGSYNTNKGSYNSNKGSHSSSQSDYSSQGGYNGNRPANAHNYETGETGYGPSQKPNDYNKPLYGSAQGSYGSQNSYKGSYSNSYNEQTSLQASYGNHASYDTHRPPHGNYQDGYGQSGYQKPQKPSNSNDKPYDSNQSGYGSNQAEYGSNQSGYGSNQGTHSSTQSSYGNTQSSYGSSSSSHGSTHSDYGGSGYGNSHGSSQGNQGSQNGYGTTQSSYGGSQGSHGSSQGGYGSSGTSHGYGSSHSSGESQYADHSTYGGYGNRPSHDQRPGYGNARPDYGNRPDYDYERPGYGQKPGYGDQNTGFDSPSTGYGQKPGYNDQKPGYNDQKPGYNDQKPGYDEKPYYNDTDYRPDVKPVYEYEIDRPTNVPAYIARPGGEVVTSRPVVIGDYGERPVYKDPGLPGKEVSYKACFRRVLAGQRTLRSFVRRVMPCEVLEDCRRECATEKRFHCESFNYRMDPSFRGKGLCELMTKPIEAFDLRRDFVQDKDYDFYEIDRNSLEPNCPQTLRGPGLLHSGFLSSKDRPTRLDDRQDRPNRLDDRPNRPNRLDDWRDRNDWVGERGNGYDDGRYKGGNRRYDQRYVPYQIGLARTEDDHEKWGKYGGIYGGSHYYKNRNDYDKSIHHWGLTSEKPSYGVKAYHNYREEHKSYDHSNDRTFDYHPSNDHHDFDYHDKNEHRITFDHDKHRNDYHNNDHHKFDYHSLGKDDDGFDYHSLGKDDGREYSSGEDFYGVGKGLNRYGYGAWKRGRWNSSGVSNGLDFEEEPSKIYYEPVDRSDEPSSKDCYARRRPGMSLSTGAIRRSLVARNVVACETACFTEKEFKCVSYSYRYSNSRGSDNCFLSERPFHGLDLSSDSGSDVYAMPQEQGCSAVSHTPWIESECFYHVRSDTVVSGSAVKSTLTVAGLGACEAECIRAQGFFCRGFSFRFDPPTIGEELPNCILTPAPTPSAGGGAGGAVRRAAGHELYARGSYGRGCEPHAQDDKDNGECYLQYDKAAKLTPSAIRGQARVKDEKACSTACTEAPFRCLSFSYNNNAPSSTDNCLLSEIRLFDLQKDVDYIHSSDDWLFAFDIFNSRCWRKVHSEEPSPEIPHPIIHPSSEEDSYPGSGPSGPGYIQEHPSGPPSGPHSGPPEIPYIPASGPPSGPGYHPSPPELEYKPSGSYKPSGPYPNGPGFKPGYRPQEPSTYPSDGFKPGYRPQEPSPYPSDGFKPGYRPQEPSSYPSDGFKPGYRPQEPSSYPSDGFKPGYRPQEPGSYPNEGLKPAYGPPEPETYKPSYRPDPESYKPSYRPDPESYKPSYRPDPESYKPSFRPDGPPFRPPDREGYKPFRPERPDFRPELPGYGPPEPYPAKPGQPALRPGSAVKPGYGDRPGYVPEDRRPGYGPQRPGPQGDREGGPLEMSWRHYTVSGFPCREGTSCAQNHIVGHWACEPEGGEVGSWDYCCAPSHRCGYSEGFHKPWCYVGPKEDQWRPCSEKYYPYHQHNVPHPSSQGQGQGQGQGQIQSHRDDNRPSVRPWRDSPPHKPDYIPHWDQPPGPYLSPADKQYWDDLYENGPKAYYDKFGNPLPGYSRVPTENQPRIKNRYNYNRPGSGHWVPVSHEDPTGVPGALGAPRYWPVAYLHKSPPPNTTYFRYNETRPTTTTERHDRTTTIPPRELPPQSRTIDQPDDLDAKSSRDDKKINVSNTEDVFNIDLDNDTAAVSTTEVPIPKTPIVKVVNVSEVDAMKTESYKELDRIDGIDDKLDDFSKSIEVLDIEDAKGDKLSDLKTLEAEERQIEAIGRLLASRRGTKLVIEKRSQKDLETKNIAIDQDLVDFNFGNRFPTAERRTERRGVIKRISKDEIERDRNIDRSLEVSETTFVRPPRVLSTTESIRKAIVNGKIFYDATIREQRDLFPNFTQQNVRHEETTLSNNNFREQRDLYLNSTRKPKHLRRVDETTTMANKQKDLTQTNTRKGKSLRPLEDSLSVSNTKNLREERDTVHNNTRKSKQRRVDSSPTANVTSSLREQRDLYLGSTRKGNFRKLEDSSTPSVIGNNNFGKRKVIKPRNVNPVRRVRRVYRKRYNPEEVRKRLLERDRNKNSTEYSRKI